MAMSRNIIAAIIVGTGVVAVAVWAFAPRPVAVEVAYASRGRFETTIADDARTRVRDRYTIVAPLAGRLTRIALREGDEVAANATVAVLSPTLAPLLDARTLRELEARVGATEAAIRRAGSRVERARVAVDQARSDLARSEKLFERKLIPQARLESNRLALAAAERELEGAREDRHVAEHELEQARAALESAQESSRRSRAVAFEVRSPITGRVLKIHEASETVVAVGAPLLEVGDTSRIEIVAELLTTDALAATPGSTVRIRDWGGPGMLEGRVRRVEPSAFTKISALGAEEQRVNVLIDLTSVAEQWRALGDGYRVGVEIVTLGVDDVLRVPASAVFPHADSADATRMAVFRIEDGRARLTEVEVGARNDSLAWIESGLDPGDCVIIYPGDAVAEGAHVVERATSAGP
jgi:HlyD family secretion protein